MRFNQPNFGNMMQNINDIPSPKQLWSSEKEKYRHWIILFGIGALVVLILTLTATIMNILSEDLIKTRLVNSYIAADIEPAAAVISANNYFRTTIQILPILTITMLTIGIVMYAYTIFRSYEKKSFARISSISTIVIGIGAFLAIYNVISIIWNSSSFVASLGIVPGTIFQFINYFINIFVYMFFSVRVSRIRKLFQRSEIVEKQKASPEYQNMMNQMKNGNWQGGNNPYGPYMNNPPQQSNTMQPKVASQQPLQPGGNASVQNQQPKSVQDIEKEKLMELTKAELLKIAKSLSVSGSDGMKKSELVDVILKIASSKNN